MAAQRQHVAYREAEKISGGKWHRNGGGNNIKRGGVAAAASASSAKAKSASSASAALSGICQQYRVSASRLAGHQLISWRIAPAIIESGGIVSA